MGTEEYGKVIAKNLKRIAYEHHKTQLEIAKDLGLKQSTISSWMTGTRTPRMPKIDMLCSYFNVSRAEIMEEEPMLHREDVSNDERELLRLFRSLSSEGRTAALNTLLGFQTIPAYTKKDSLKAG